jgi:hypothetical protein
MIRFAALGAALLQLAVWPVAGHEEQEGLRNVAIIGNYRMAPAALRLWRLSTTYQQELTKHPKGAGAAGSTAAYYLRQFADEARVSVNITIFEKEDRIGGRTLTVSPYGAATHPVELGATIFVPVNHILYDNAKKFNLSMRDGMDETPGRLVVWDGEKVRYDQDSDSWSWWNYAKLFWKYGMAPYRTKKLVQAAVSAYLKLYEEPSFPFRSLTERAYELGLVKLTGVTGKQYLEANNVRRLSRMTRNMVVPSANPWRRLARHSPMI